LDNCYFIDLRKGALVKPFVEAVSRLSCACSVVQGRTVLDAKSILGIYSLDLSELLLMRLENCTEGTTDLLKEYIVT